MMTFRVKSMMRVTLAALLSALFLAAAAGAQEEIQARIELDTGGALLGQEVDAVVLLDLEGVSDLVGAYAAELSWDREILELVEIVGGESHPFQGPLTNVGSDRVSFSHFSVRGAAGAVTLLRVRYRVVGGIGRSTAVQLSFNTLDASGTFQSLLPQLLVSPASLFVIQEDLPTIRARVDVSALKPAVNRRLEVELVVDMGATPEKLGAYEARLSWNKNVLTLADLSDGEALEFLDPITRAEEAAVMVSHFSVSGASGEISLLKAQFDIVGDVGQRSGLALLFSTLDAAGTFSNLLPQLQLLPAVVEIAPAVAEDPAAEDAEVLHDEGTPELPDVSFDPDPLPSADFSRDGHVGLADFFMFADYFGTFNSEYDLTGDGEVGFDDFFRFSDFYGKPLPALE